MSRGSALCVQVAKQLWFFTEQHPLLAIQAIHLFVCCFCSGHWVARSLNIMHVLQKDCPFAVPVGHGVRPPLIAPVVTSPASSQLSFVFKASPFSEPGSACGTYALWACSETHAIATSWIRAEQKSWLLHLLSIVSHWRPTRPMLHVDMFMALGTASQVNTTFE